MNLFVKIENLFIGMKWSWVTLPLRRFHYLGKIYYSKKMLLKRSSERVTDTMKCEIITKLSKN